MDISAVSRKEVLRYLGYKGTMEIQGAVEDEVEACLELLGQKAEPKHLVRSFPLRLGTEYEIDCGCFCTRSKNLSKNLQECEMVLVFAATLGLGTDYVIQKYNHLQMSRAVILQAAAAAMIEEYCDQVCRELKERYEAGEWYLRPRFSPGYGDFPLECQSSLLDGLEGKTPGNPADVRVSDDALQVRYSGYGT